MTLAAAVALAAGFALAGRAIGWLTPSGTIAAALVGAAIFAGGGLPGAVLLALLFVSGSALTYRFGASRAELPTSQRHGRTGRQVLANGVWAAAGALLVTVGDAGWAVMAGALATAQADTWATEIGARDPADTAHHIGPARHARYLGRRDGTGHRRWAAGCRGDGWRGGAARVPHGDRPGGRRRGRPRHARRLGPRCHPPGGVLLRPLRRANRMGRAPLWRAGTTRAWTPMVGKRRRELGSHRAGSRGGLRPLLILELGQPIQ